MKRLFAFDDQFKKAAAFSGRMAGVDEAGRGPLAGPVIAAAVILAKKSSFSGLDDSKKVPPGIREILYLEILKTSLVGIGIVGEELIDEMNIYQASRLAMKKAVLALSRTPDYLLIDGRATLDVPLPQKAVVGGDGKSAAIAAASIIAKVTRDRWMNALDAIYPGYEFKKHKGYGTRLHLEKLQSLGPSPVHRKSFSPVRILFEETPV